MATYTDVDLFTRDYMPVGADDVLRRLIQRGAEMAYAYINSRLSVRYTVPFSATYPAEVVAISDMLTKCFTLSLQTKRGPVLPKGGRGNRDGVDDGCKLAVCWLDDIVAGRAELTDTPTATGVAAYFTRSGYKPIFDVDDSTQHRPDPALIEKIDAEREE
jgi:hypothetical protein